MLIVGPAWVGDMVMAQTLFILLKKRLPATVIDVLAPQWSEPLLARMPQVRRSIALPIGHGRLKLAQQFKMARQLRYENYDQAILLPNSFKSAIIPFLARIPKRRGWCGEYRYGLLNDMRHLNKSELPLMIERFMALALPKAQNLKQALAGERIIPALEVKQQHARAIAKTFNLDLDKGPILALCPGAEFGAAKKWPNRHYVAVAQEKIAQGWQVWIFGSQKDQQEGAVIQEQTGQACVNLAGRTLLSEAIDLLSLADSVVSNDSGLMHIAAALNRPLVVLYGSSSPEFTPPLNRYHRILRLGLSCSPCFKRECPLEHLNCLNELAPELVLEALQSLEHQKSRKEIL